MYSLSTPVNRKKINNEDQIKEIKNENNKDSSNFYESIDQNDTTINI
jgi:hypothetical protein